MHLKNSPTDGSRSDQRPRSTGAGRPLPVIRAASAWDALRDELRSLPPETAGTIPLFAWESPEGESLAALGIAAEWRGTVGANDTGGSGGPGGADLFREARAGVDRLFASACAARENAGDLTRGPLGEVPGFPVAFGGFPFASEETGQGRPAGSPAGFAGPRFFVPLRAWRVTAEGRAIEWCAARDLELPSGAGGEPMGANLPRQGSFDPESWMASVRATLDRIHGGRLEKAVLARSVEITAAAPFDSIRIFEALRAGQPGTHRFLLRDRAGLAFVGASPERLVRMAEGVVRSEAVAGTARRGGNAAEDARLGAALLASDKDRREHASVAREIRAALLALCDRVEADAEPRLLALRHLLHLRTVLRAAPRAGTHVFDLLARLHPTPAVAGVPRAPALDWIRRTEPCPRGWYSGPVGWVTASGEGDFAVGIRSATLHGRHALVFAGAGIVAGSDPEAEWAETELKMRSMRDVLADA